MTEEEKKEKKWRETVQKYWHKTKDFVTNKMASPLKSWGSLIAVEKEVPPQVKRWRKSGYDWWRKEVVLVFSKASEGDSRSRAIALITVVETEAVFLFIFWVFGSITLFLDFLTSYKLYYVIVILVTAPPAYVIWHWRDKNRRDEIDNNRHDTLLKDFHQVEQWATTIPEEGKISITQTAAIYQLRPYLIGKHGEAFMRPTYEIYKALLDSWQPERGEFGRIQDDSPSYVKDIHKVVFEEIKFFTKDFKKSRENFGIEAGRTLLSTLDLKGIYLAFKKLAGAYLYKANLTFADLTGAKLEGAHLYKAKYSPVTKFPDGFDPTKEHGMTLIDDDEKNANPDFRG